MNGRILLPLLLAWYSASGAAFGATGNYDFDHDGDADLTVYDRATGNWYVQRSSDHSVLFQNWGWDASVPVPGDYDGDLETDFAVYHRANGDWYIFESMTGTLRKKNFGWAGAVAVPADYDGDGECDIAVYARATGDWYILQSQTGTIRIRNWGWAGARPVPADYDGDGKADIAVYAPASGDWYILQSQTATLRQQNWGWSAARPVCGSFDGDSKADIAVYVPSTGDWYILQSQSGTLRYQNFGWFEAVSCPADYDGDGETDFAVYYPGGGTWYILKSQTGTVGTQNWGWSEARAVPSYLNGANENIRIHCHGDSITYGLGSSSDGPETGYPALLETVLEPSHGGDFTMFNYGKSGETTRGGLSRLAADLDVTEPDVLLLMQGTNDHFFNSPASGIESNLRSMITTAQNRGILVVLATIPPVITNEFRDRSAQQSRIVAFNPTIYDIAADLDVPVAQVYEYITAVPDWEDDLMDQPTANHPNDEGYTYVRDAFFDALTAELFDPGLLY